MEFNATFIVAFVSFIIFIIIMNQILYKPINEIIEKRQNLIDENYIDADKNQEKSKAILQDRLDKLQNAKSRVKEGTSVALNEAKKENFDNQEKIKQEAKLKIKENTDILNESKDLAIETLKKDVINLAQTIADKFFETPERIENIDNETIEKIMQE